MKREIGASVDAFHVQTSWLEREVAIIFLSLVTTQSKMYTAESSDCSRVGREVLDGVEKVVKVFAVECVNGEEVEGGSCSGADASLDVSGV